MTEASNTNSMGSEVQEVRDTLASKTARGHRRNVVTVSSSTSSGWDWQNATITLSFKARVPNLPDLMLDD